MAEKKLENGLYSVGVGCHEPQWCLSSYNRVCVGDSDPFSSDWLRVQALESVVDVVDEGQLVGVLWIAE